MWRTGVTNDRQNKKTSELEEEFRKYVFDYYESKFGYKMPDLEISPMETPSAEIHQILKKWEK